MTKMRAKVHVQNVIPNKFSGDDTVTSETLILYPVARSGSYPADGSDEDNTFAKFSPSGRFELTIANPNLIGQFEVGQRYYVDFTQAD